MTPPERRQLNPAKVRAARELAGITTAVAAAAAQLSQVAYFRWENLKKGPLRRFDSQRAELLATRLNKTFEDLTDPLDLATAEGCASTEAAPAQAVG